MDKKITHQEIIGATGVKLHVLTSGAGPLILFLHGFPEFASVWTPQLHEFGHDYLAAALDLRGYGRSDKPIDVSAYTLDVLVEDVRRTIETLSPSQPAVIVGHDWGGIVGWAFARAYPHLLDRLIVINGPHPAVFARELAYNTSQRFASSFMLFYRSRGVAEEVLASVDFALLRRMVFGRTKCPEAFTPEQRAEYLEAWKRPGALTGALNYFRAAQGFRQTRLENWHISVPTMVLWGEADPILLTGNLRGLDEYVSSLALHRHPTATHWIVHEEPEWIHAHIRGFLGAIAKKGTLRSHSTEAQVA